MSHDKTPLEPHQPIIDPHLHQWDVLPAPGSLIAPNRFLFDEMQEVISDSGHNITHTVFVECHAMLRSDGPEELRPVGETEFASGIAAMCASGNYGDLRACHRIVSTANLLLGAGVRPVIDAHAAAGGERFAGIRMSTAWSTEGMFGFPPDPSLQGLMTCNEYREGARVLSDMGYSLDVWCLHTQLEEVIALADALPDLQIVLDHVGTPESQGKWQTRQAEAREQWSASIRELARRPSVVVKLGGLGMSMSSPVGGGSRNASSEILAEEWRPTIETCIEAFGPERAMFESNFPPDRDSGTYGATWNAFKIIAKACSADEKDALFRGTAARIYRIEL
jgi:predicted TIM-barrel fold metal-dependent hydrolase